METLLSFLNEWNEFCDIKDISQWINGCESMTTTSKLGYFVIIAICVQQLL
jgi:hypothetical protein